METVLGTNDAWNLGISVCKRLIQKWKIIVLSTRLRHKYIGCEREETMDDLTKF